MSSLLKIPTAHVVALTKLATADDNAFDTLSKGLRELGPTASREALLDYLGPYAAALGEGLVVNDLVSVLLSAQVTRIRYQWTSSRAASEVFDSALADDKEVNRADFVRRFATLLDLPGLSRTAKAIDILTESAHLYHDARIITDIRPVFGDKVTEPPEAALIVHRLRIEFHDTEGIGTMFFTLDPKDVEQLGKVVRRAEEKESTLRSMLTRFELSVLDTEGDE